MQQSNVLSYSHDSLFPAIMTYNNINTEDVNFERQPRKYYCNDFIGRTIIESSPNMTINDGFSYLVFENDTTVVTIIVGRMKHETARKILNHISSKYSIINIKNSTDYYNQLKKWGYKKNKPNSWNELYYIVRKIMTWQDAIKLFGEFGVNYIVVK